MIDHSPTNEAEYFSLLSVFSEDGGRDLLCFVFSLKAVNHCAMGCADERTSKQRRRFIDMMRDR